MPADWKHIRVVRQDLTDWVIHWTRGQSSEGQYESAFQVLQRILQCGYLKPTYAPRWRRPFRWNNSNTIQGPHPAVCFTDQTLSAFIQSCKALSTHYSSYGIAFEKQNLFLYGGRPVIYGDKQLLARLNEEDKYLWVYYTPILSEISNYPSDWTHEREWRTRVRPHLIRDLWAKTPEDGMPLVLLPKYIDGEWELSLPRILVQTLEEAIQLRTWLIGLPEYNGANDFTRWLYASFNELKIIPLDIVSERLEAGDSRWARLETLPWDEVPQ